MDWIASIVAAALSRQLVDEFKAWAPRLTEWIIRWAARVLPSAQCERYEEEWLSHNNEIPGEIGKIAHAVGCLWAAPSMCELLSLTNMLSWLLRNRLLSMAGSAVALVLFAPLIAGVAIFIRFRSSGPILIKKKHVDRSGKEVVFWFFHIADPPPDTSSASDKYWILTPAGVTVYRLGLDILPTLFNVATGNLGLDVWLRMLALRAPVE